MLQIQGKSEIFQKNDPEKIKSAGYGMFHNLADSICFSENSYAERGIIVYKALLKTDEINSIL